MFFPKSAFAAVLLLTVVATLQATKQTVVPAADLKVPQGFRADIIASFPKGQASIISMTVDKQGHILASSQNDKLFRIVPGELNQRPGVTSIHDVPKNLGGAHGLLYKSNYLYLVKADGNGARGVYRLADTNGQGQFADPELIVPLTGKGEHGGHGLVAGPRGEWIYLVAGNATPAPESLNKDLVPATRATEFHTPPDRQGWVMRFSPDSKVREMYCQGLRNAYDLAFNQHGDLFTFDSDNEGFMGLPWYRPTNVYHLISGADYGWRQSPNNLLGYHPDTVPSVVEIGPGSPTGIVFGTGTHFPEKYQRCLFACDWSYGRIYAVHFKQDGATYRGDWEFFATGTPLPVTDIVVGHDGALYFATGGRGNQSRIYRISHKQPSNPVSLTVPSEATQLRQNISALNQNTSPIDYSVLEPYLRSEDRTLRYAARVALELQPFETWKDRIFVQLDKTALLAGLVAVTRQAPVSYQQPILQKLLSLTWDDLTRDQRLASLRVFSILLERMGPPSDGDKTRILTYLDSLYPATSNNVNKELATILSRFRPDGFTDRTLDSISHAESLMTQLHFLSILMDQGIHDFSEAQKKQLTAAINPYELRAVAHRKYRTQSEELQKLIRTLGLPEVTDRLPNLPVVQNWSLHDLLSLAKPDQLLKADLKNGKQAYRTVRCDNCHRIGNAGGVLGPNLNGIAGRYTPAAILEHIVNPSKVIPDQYQSTIFAMHDGRQITGQIVNLSSGKYSIRTDPFRPFARTDIPANEIEQIIPSRTSLMPTGLLDPLTKEEIRDLLGYLLDPQ